MEPFMAAVVLWLDSFRSTPSGVLLATPSPCHVGEPRRAVGLQARFSAGWHTLWCASAGDVLETGDFGGDKLSGQAFRGRKRISEHGKHLEPVFGGELANLEAQAAQKTQDTKNALFGVLSTFCSKNGAVTKR